MSKHPPPHSVNVILASAGTGKTYTLTKRLEHEVRNGRDPAKIIATTFTVMAAEELRVRARKHLIEEGLAEPAIKLLGARIGTVNSVSGQLISEFALMMGRSPIHEVIPEESQRSSLFSAAAEAIATHAGTLDRLAAQFGYNSTWPRRDWRDDLWEVIDRARLNRIDADQLAGCAERSWQSLAPLFADKIRIDTGMALDDALRSALEATLACFPDTTDLTKKTIEALTEVRQALDVIRAGDPLPWQIWVRLSRLEPAKKDQQDFIELCERAAAHSRHPRLQADCENYIHTVFQCAAEAMSRYELYKAARGLVDFVDQERLALSALEDPKIAASLAERTRSRICRRVPGYEPSAARTLCSAVPYCWKQRLGGRPQTGHLRVPRHRSPPHQGRCSEDRGKYDGWSARYSQEELSVTSRARPLCQ